MAAEFPGEGAVRRRGEPLEGGRVGRGEGGVRQGGSSEGREVGVEEGRHVGREAVQEAIVGREGGREGAIVGRDGSCRGGEVSSQIPREGRCLKGALSRNFGGRGSPIQSVAPLAVSVVLYHTFLQSTQNSEQRRDKSDIR